MNLDDMKKICEFYEKLGDEESKEIYEARWKLYNDHDRISFMRTILGMYSDWNIVDFPSYYERICSINLKKLVIYGYGNAGTINKILLEKCGYTVDYIVDRRYQQLNTQICEEDVPIFSPQKLYHDKDVPIVLISISDLWEERTIIRTLRELYKLPGENIYLPQIGGTLLGNRGNQYFDLPYIMKEDEEIFVDGGCYDGNTTKCFKNWAGDKFKKSIAFECDKRSIAAIKENMKELVEKDQFDLFEMGLYSKKAELHFVESTLPTSSYINDAGKIKIPVNSIDNVLKGEKVTFIKLDVQGGELEALKGAKRTIEQYQPKLAVSLYHKESDLYEIPLWLMRLSQQYKFYIRHYNSDECETVLYAI